MAWFMQGTTSYQGSMILFLFYTYTTRCPFHLYWSTKFQAWSSPLISPGMLLNLLLVFSRSHYAGDCLPFFSNPYHAFPTIFLLILLNELTVIFKILPWLHHSFFPPFKINDYPLSVNDSSSYTAYSNISSYTYSQTMFPVTKWVMKLSNPISFLV